MTLQESSPVLFTPDVTQTTRDAAGISQQLKENVLCFTLNTWALKIAELACVSIWKLKVAYLGMVSLMEKSGTVDLGQLLVKPITLVSYNKGLIIMIMVMITITMTNTMTMIMMDDDDDDDSRGLYYRLFT